MAVEARCTELGSGCVFSDMFQGTNYTRTEFGANYALFTDDNSDMPGLCNQPAVGAASISIQDGPGNTFADNFEISTDADILALLPNRDTGEVARFLRTIDAFQNTPRFGYSPIPLGTTVKRLALRWYSYHTPTYDFAFQNSCTNGKIAHSSAAVWGESPLFTFQTYGTTTNHYSFIPGGFGGGPTPSWVWTGHSDFDGIVGGSGTHPGTAFPINDWKGKWFRNEIIVRRPRNADSQAGGLGYDFQFFTKNVTDDTAEVEDTRFSSGCTECLFDEGVPGQDFVWNTGTYPTEDMPSLHTEFYRAGTCAGWTGWIYAMAAKWDTDTGSERIGAASEVEGGDAPDATLTRNVIFLN